MYEILILGIVVFVFGILALLKEPAGGFVLIFGGIVLIWFGGMGAYYENIANQSMSDLERELTPIMKNRSITEEQKFIQIQLACNKIADTNKVDRCIGDLTIKFLR